MQVSGNIKTQTFLYGIPDGKNGIIETLKLMRLVTQKGKINFLIRRKALFLIENLQQKDKMREVKALWEYVKNEVRYVHDISDVETIQTPDKTLELMAGDCDDKSILLATLLESIGFKTRFVAVGKNTNNYCHVFVETFVNNKWLALETTEPVKMGWKPPTLPARLIIHN